MMSRLALLTVAVAAASTGVFAQADIVLTSEADTFIKRSDPNQNFGLQPLLEIKNAAAAASGTNFDRKAYFRFDTSALTTPSAYSYILEMTGILGDGNTGNIGNGQLFSVYGLNDGDPGETWDETLITWKNAPQNDTTSASGLLSNTTLLGTFMIDGTGVGTTISFGSSGLNDFIQSDSNNNLTLVVVRESF